MENDVAMKQRSIVWFMNDLRLSDNPALHEAASQGEVMPLFILDDTIPLGSASRWWLHHSLSALNQSLNNGLNVYHGQAESIIFDCIKRNRIDAVYWNRCYEPAAIALRASIKALLKKHGVSVMSFNGSLLFEPTAIIKNDGTPYKVFTPYYNRVVAESHAIPSVLKKPSTIKTIADKKSLNLDDLNLMPRIPWYKTMEKVWDVGEQAALKRLKQFLRHGLLGYKEGRDFPSKDNISRLSPHLHFGEISPSQIWHEVGDVAHGSYQKDAVHFLRELVWREFSYYLLYYFNDLPTVNWQKKFDNFAWAHNARHLRLWQQGKTGIPLVDAGMRELWQTGFMHNRVRMVTASFLCKNLLLDWRLGASWFFDCLVDADVANNSASWQWVFGSGADAAPYFRIFNPTTQGEKFDPDGSYTKRFIPELQSLPLKYLFKPWAAPKEVLSKAGIILGKTYPKPIIDLSISRARALEAYAMSKQRY